MNKRILQRVFPAVLAAFLLVSTHASAQWMPSAPGIWYNNLVGIGIPQPLDQLHIHHDATFPMPSHALRISQSDGACTATAQMSIESPLRPPALSAVATNGDLVIRTLRNNQDPHAGTCAEDIILAAQVPGGAIRFTTWNGQMGPDSEKMTVDWNGNVGIGTGDNGSPQAKLHVVGDNALILEGTSPTFHAAPWLLFKEQGHDDYWALIKRGSQWGGAGQGDRLLFSFKDITQSPYSEVWHTSLEMLPNGYSHFYNNVGIGTQPKSGIRLHVNGGPVVIGDKHQIAPGRDDYKLAVDGLIVAHEVWVSTSNWAWPDFVFADDYNLMPLNEVEQNIRENRHLPGIPSAAEVKENGVNVVEMQTKLLQKIEELTLYVIEQEKKISTLEAQITGGK